MDHELLLYGLTILLFLLVSAFFSAAETALTAVSRARLYQLVMDGNRAAQIVSKLRRNKESLIGTVLLGNTAVNVAASAMATSLAITLYGSEGELVALVTLAMTLLLVVFAEILPKTYAIQNAERVSLALAIPVNFIVILFYPITWSVRLFIRLLFMLFGVDITKTDALISATDVLRGTIELHHREGKMGLFGLKLIFACIPYAGVYDCFIVITIRKKRIMQQQQAFSRQGIFAMLVIAVIVGGIITLMMKDIPAKQHPVEQPLDAKAFLEQKQ